MENDRVQTYRRIASTMFNDGVINMGRALVLFAFTSQMVQHVHSIPRVHGSFGTFTILFLKGRNTNTSIDRSFTNQNRGKGTNQKGPFHKPLTNRNTECLSNQIRRYERNRPIRHINIKEYFVIF
jgi:hypothetical protein